MVEFYDHCENHPRPMVCRIYGEVTEIDPKFVKLKGWGLIGEDAETMRNNETEWLVIRSCIREAKRLFPK